MLVFGVLVGIFLAIGASLALFVQRAWRPHAAELVRVEEMKGYHDVERHPEGKRVPGLVLYRFDAPLFFANSDYFRTQIQKLAIRPGTVRIVVTAEPMTDVDATAAEMSQLLDDLDELGVELCFAGLKGPVREKFEQLGVMQRTGTWTRTVGESVRSYVADHDVEWLDWEDRDKSL